MSVETPSMHSHLAITTQNATAAACATEYNTALVKQILPHIHVASATAPSSIIYTGHSSGMQDVAKCDCVAKWLTVV